MGFYSVKLKKRKIDEKDSDFKVSQKNGIFPTGRKTLIGDKSGNKKEWRGIIEELYEKKVWQ